MELYRKLSEIDTKKRLSDADILNVSRLIKNHLSGNVKLKYNDLARLKEYKETMRKLSQPINKVSLRQRRSIINQQGSGFLSVLLPISIAALWNILSQK